METTAYLQDAAPETAQEEMIHDLPGEAAAAQDGSEGAQGAQPDVQQDTQPDAPDAEQAVRQQIESEIAALLEDGWTAEQLRAFAADQQALSEMAAGSSARRAATAYLMRRAQGQRPARHGVPALRTAAGGVPRTNAIDRMSSSEFARFSDGLYERLLAGERISL